VTALADNQLTAINFGLVEFKSDFTQSQQVSLNNTGNTDATFNVSVELKQGSPHAVSLDKTQVKVKAGGNANVRVTLNVPAATAGNSDDFRDVAGLIKFTPASASDNGGIALRVPYYMVARVYSNVQASLDKNVKSSNPNGTINLTNKNSPIAATADFYSWGLSGNGKGSSKKNPIINLSAAGVQSFPISATDQLLVFAITTQEAWSSPSTREFDVDIDVNGDGVPDFAVVGVDIGLVTTGAFDGRIAAVVFDLSTGAGHIDFLAQASTDGSTILIPAKASRLGLTAAHPRFTYTATGFDLVESGAQDSFSQSAGYNAFSSALTDAQFVTLLPNATAAVPFSVNLTELAQTPPLGFMVVTQDNQNGDTEANLVKVDVKK
jgi:hypothetical protein